MQKIKHVQQKNTHTHPEKQQMQLNVHRQQYSSYSDTPNMNENT